jgi:ribosomal protein S18 acetylase RimI-like enzyme
MLPAMFVVVGSLTHRPMNIMELQQAVSQEQIDSVRVLFEEYAASLDFNLCFQNFATELADLPGAYAPPDGALLLAVEAGEAAGCVALRRSSDDACEMKRLYIRPRYRGRGAGRMLAEAIVEQGRLLGYRSMRLDTIPSMRQAQALYESLGFTDIAAYYHNPIEGARYMELQLVERNDPSQRSRS